MCVIFTKLGFYDATGRWINIDENYCELDFGNQYS